MHPSCQSEKGIASGVEREPYQQDWQCQCRGSVVRGGSRWDLERGKRGATEWGEGIQGVKKRRSSVRAQGKAKGAGNLSRHGGRAPPCSLAWSPT